MIYIELLALLIFGIGFFITFGYFLPYIILDIQIHAKEGKK